MFYIQCTETCVSFHTKDITRKEHRHGLVYKATCGHEGCSEFYIGETGRRF